MNLPELSTATSATVDLVPHLGREGETVIVVVMKQLFQVDRRDRVHRVGGAKLRMTDEPWGDEDTSSIKLPSDVCIRKVTTDVVVVGDAMGVYQPSVTELDVLLRVGPVKKLLRVFGPRVWYRSLTAVVLSDPARFTSQRVSWEHAFGGTDDSDPTDVLEEPRNPVGRGLARAPATLIDQLGPCIEDPTDLLASHRSRPAPAGLGAIARHWMPRRQYGGTYDAAWRRERMPLPPLDFDERFNQVATPALITPTPLRGGEPVDVVNMCAGSLQFPLPRIAFFVGATFESGRKEYRSMLDTVVLLPNERQVELTWRAPVLVPKHGSKLRAVRVYEKRIL